ncbi:hypothetical protein B0H14DRAFT_726593 [Mycena olivaceomarginata]|nr:hypothetical protein B0H14DRAFT_726593 [Mycena olivaceomarginata]
MVGLRCPLRHLQPLPTGAVVSSAAGIVTAVDGLAKFITTGLTNTLSSITSGPSLNGEIQTLVNGLSPLVNAAVTALSSLPAAARTLTATELGRGPVICFGGSRTRFDRLNALGLPATNYYRSHACSWSGPERYSDLVVGRGPVATSPIAGAGSSAAAAASSVASGVASAVSSAADVVPSALSSVDLSASSVLSAVSSIVSNGGTVVTGALSSALSAASVAPSVASQCRWRCHHVHRIPRRR